MTNLVNVHMQAKNKPVSYAGTRVKHTEVEKLLKYVNNESLTTKPDTFTSTAKNAASTAALFEGVPFVNMLRKNKHAVNGGKFYSDGMKQLQTNLNDAKKALFDKSTGKLGTRLKNYMKAVDENQKAYSQLKSKVAERFSTRNMTAEAIEEAAKETATKSPSLFSRAGKAIAKPFKKLGSAIGKPFKKLGSAIGKRLPQSVKNVGSKAGGLLKTSGAGFMLAIDGVMETAFEVVPTFKELGAKKGWKQVGKSSVKVVGNTAGYILGAKAGAAIGSFICPGIGTAAGAACGFIGGMIGQFITGKITKKIVGKSEREKAQAEQQKQSVADIAKDPKAFEELKTMALAKIQEESQYTGGQLSQDSKVILRTIENIEKSNPFSAVV